MKEGSNINLNGKNSKIVLIIVQVTGTKLFL